MVIPATRFARTFSLASARLPHRRVGGLTRCPSWLTTIRGMLMVGQDGDMSSTPLRRTGNRPPGTADDWALREVAFKIRRADVIPLSGHNA